MRAGTRLGLDPGEARIGVARSDPSGFLATPVETVQRGPGDLDRLATLLEETGAIEVLVGLPRSLSGGEGPVGDAGPGVRRSACAARRTRACPAL